MNILFTMICEIGFRILDSNVAARCHDENGTVQVKEAKGKAGQSSDALARCADIPLALRYAHPSFPGRDYFLLGALRLFLHGGSNDIFDTSNRSKTIVLCV